MARRLFFVPEVRNGAAELRGEEAKHLTRVLRVEPGQTYQLSDNRFLYEGRVDAAHKELVRFLITAKHPVEPPSCEITLCAALIKFDHFEWLVEKATELGVSRIVPVQATRSERGLERAAIKRVDRWRKIALEASQQSRRPLLPVIADAVEFGEILALEADARFMADEEGGTPFATAIPDRAARIAILVGPEGGWTEEERASAQGRWTRVSLSPNILRAETAATAALAIACNRLLI